MNVQMCELKAEMLFIPTSSLWHSASLSGRRGNKRERRQKRSNQLMILTPYTNSLYCKLLLTPYTVSLYFLPILLLIALAFAIPIAVTVAIAVPIAFVIIAFTGATHAIEDKEQIFKFIAFNQVVYKGHRFTRRTGCI
jgi:hypothetical protein